jgi:hypothetical protein
LKRRVLHKGAAAEPERGRSVRPPSSRIPMSVTRVHRSSSENPKAFSLTNALAEAKQHAGDTSTACAHTTTGLARKTQRECTTQSKRLRGVCISPVASGACA